MARAAKKAAAKAKREADQEVKKAAANAKKEAKKTALIPKLEDIEHLFNSSDIEDNDLINKIREKVWAHALAPLQSYLDDPIHGIRWRHVHEKLHLYLKKYSNDVPYDSVRLTLKGGRKYNYDADAQYYTGSELILTQKQEFKFGASNIGGCPQFLSLQAKVNLFPLTYDQFFHDNYLSAYIAADPGLTELPPSRTDYLKQVTKTNFTCHPFFKQAYERDNKIWNANVDNKTTKAARDKVVNDSIRVYLETYGISIDIAKFQQKIRDSQTDKHYCLWHNDAFHHDQIAEAEMSGLTFDSIENGNRIVVRSEAGTVYKLLLRWRNHKGILNPAWQISMERPGA